MEPKTLEPKHSQAGSQANPMYAQSQEPILNGTVQNQLGRRLRVLFDGQSSPPPDRFQELLAELDRKLSHPGE